MTTNSRVPIRRPGRPISGKRSQFPTAARTSCTCRPAAPGLSRAMQARAAARTRKSGWVQTNRSSAWAVHRLVLMTAPTRPHPHARPRDPCPPDGYLRRSQPIAIPALPRNPARPAQSPRISGDPGSPRSHRAERSTRAPYGRLPGLSCSCCSCLNDHYVPLHCTTLCGNRATSQPLPCLSRAPVLNPRPSLPGRWHPPRLCPPPVGPRPWGVAIPAWADSQRE